MKPGSVIVDLGADGGGNCELSKPGETVQAGGVTIIAPLNLPATMPYHASLLFSRNLTAFIWRSRRTSVPARFQRRHPAGRRDHLRRRGEAPRTREALQKGSLTSTSGRRLFVFVLASFIGLGVIRSVSRLLHTPLMSLTNAISAIAVVGAILVTGGDYPLSIRILGAVALFASMTNIVSGFLITDRMLKMFKTDKPGGRRKR